MTKRLETLESILERLRLSIKKNGLKNSKQREEIISVLYKNGTHLSPEEITAQIKTTDKNTSISSVYRILSFLEKEKFITTLEADKNGRRYEIAAKEHHDHIICLNCGNIIEFVDSDIERLQISIAEKFGAQLISHDMRLFVICAKCQKNNVTI
ncbi:transcriptional repressor [Helicobacter sp. 13S00401-1]|uniref:ferric iron uptake transcriptional regulator n=1 Tax=Helicobacter sp. 13S00401-1 TaxID=1905758 RepID=UPI000BA6D280|nr:Fur family transcriptional regulator [Helicobacter sp. 13S00401-1]PAF51120.1 transcriptional repressor [Helicobacter sp. 13S00401-1]